MQKHGQSPDKQIQTGFRQIMLRDLSPKKLAVLVKLYRTTEQYYQKQPGQADNLLDRPGINCATISPQLAALTVTANAMLNLDEVITKE